MEKLRTPISKRGRTVKSVARGESVERKIHRMVRRIVSRFHPDKIILFGSQARGNATEDSDVDLLIIMPVHGIRSEIEITIACALHDIGIAKDVLVTTPDKFEKRRDIVGTISFEAAHEGKTLYARST